MRRTHILSLILGLSLVVAACGADGSSGSDTTGGDDGDGTTTTVGDTTTTFVEDDDIAVPPLDPGSVVLTITNEGGFVPVEMAYHPLPTYVLLADGTLYAPGMIPLIFPGPLMPAIQAIQLDEGAMTQIMELVEAIGLPEMTEERVEDAVNVADAGDTVVRSFDANGEHSFAVFALGLGESDDPRVAATERLLEGLGLASTNGEPLGVFVPTAVEVLVADSFDAASDPASEILDWPLPVPAAEIDAVGGETGLRCIALEGEDAEYALGVFTEATQMTFFEEGGEVWRLIPRPLFPGETGCP
jgi:hypothetical protein